MLPLNGEHCGSTPEQLSDRRSCTYSGLRWPLMVAQRYYSSTLLPELCTFVHLPMGQPQAAWWVKEPLFTPSTVNAMCASGEEWTGAGEAVRRIWGCTDQKTGRALPPSRGSNRENMTGNITRRCWRSGRKADWRTVRSVSATAEERFCPFPLNPRLNSESHAAQYVALNHLCVCVCVCVCETRCVYCSTLRVFACTGCGAGAWASVEALPVALLGVVLQLHADAAHALQQHGGTVVTVCGAQGETERGREISDRVTNRHGCLSVSVWVLWRATWEAEPQRQSRGHTDVLFFLPHSYLNKNVQSAVLMEVNRLTLTSWSGVGVIVTKDQLKNAYDHLFKKNGAGVAWF